ncbi:hypothetical protein EJD97_005325 [Solanum chilense]|uniref:Uncharacterized protein n=1 Tax=Solanum chilense TaxID=4083 RepID=A0A6N2BVD4_SOLCI|nr:hypothetical protein EJD97_005325 [Solanum chilense]
MTRTNLDMSPIENHKRARGVVIIEGATNPQKSATSTNTFSSATQQIKSRCLEQKFLSTKVLVGRYFDVRTHSNLSDLSSSPGPRALIFLDGSRSSTQHIVSWFPSGKKGHPKIDVEMILAEAPLPTPASGSSSTPAPTSFSQDIGTSSDSQQGLLSYDLEDGALSPFGESKVADLRKDVDYLKPSDYTSLFEAIKIEGALATSEITLTTMGDVPMGHVAVDALKMDFDEERLGERDVVVYDDMAYLEDTMFETVR